MNPHDYCECGHQRREHGDLCLHDEFCRCAGFHQPLEDDPDIAALIDAVCVHGIGPDVLCPERDPPDSGLVWADEDANLYRPGRD